MSTTRLFKEGRVPWWLRAWRRFTARRRPVESNCRPRLEPLEDRCTPTATGFLQTNLVADTPGAAGFTNPNLVNPWGLAADSSGSFWTADNMTGLSTFYDGTGQAQSSGSFTAVTIPPPPGSPAGTVAAPTGVVFNGGPGFVVSENGWSAPSEFLFATEDGTIAGWSPSVDAGRAVLAVDDSSTLPGGGAVFKGLALGSNASGTFLYATDFRGGAVDVFDDHFHAVHLDGSFSDPTLPAGFAPFNIQNIGGKLYVTYARQDAQKYEDVPGAGNGFVDVFDTDGHLLQRLASGGALDSPWGITVAPASFGAFGNDLLVGNEGDGRINAFDPNTGAYLGALTYPGGGPITIDGLWALQFGTGAAADSLFFTAGPVEGQHGLFGKLDPAAGGSWTSVVIATASSGDSTPGDSYPLPPASGPALRPDAGIQVQPPQLPAALPVPDPVTASPLVPATSMTPVTPVTIAEARVGLAARAPQGVLSGAAEADVRPTATVISSAVAPDPGGRVAPDPGGRLAAALLPGGADDRPVPEYSAALAVVMEVSARWESGDTPAAPAPLADPPATDVDADPVPPDVGVATGLAETLPAEVRAARAAATAPAGDRPQVAEASLGWAKPLTVVVLVCALARTWYYYPPSSRRASGPPRE
jgi:uncharacterized protein (TIGR03118 family)